MATPAKVPGPFSPSEPPLSREDGFALLESMFGSFHDMYEQAGGVEAIIRETDGQEDD